MPWMSVVGKRFPGWLWSGVDLVDDLFPIGLEMMREKGCKRLPSLVKGDAYKLTECFRRKSFDVVICMQTFSFLPNHEALLDNLMQMCADGGWIFLSSLFTDFYVDARVELMQYPDANFDRSVGPFFYNTYSWDKFKAYCLAQGARQVTGQDFEIDVDLPVPENRLMGTYTLQLNDDRRLQASGPLLMPWKFVGVQMK
jgi:ubiquinone/menaquinone biosynthesis C-methylase UbiE